MVSELSFSTYSEVLDSWERIRRVKDYHTKLGNLIFTKFFSEYPEAVSIFGVECEAQECVKNGSFLKHAKNFVNMFGSLIDMLGPDVDMLTDILAEMGQTNKSRGVKLEHYPAIGSALIEAVRVLDNKCTSETELCWKQVWDGVSFDMGKALQ